MSTRILVAVGAAALAIVTACSSSGSPKNGGGASSGPANTPPPSNQPAAPAVMISLKAGVLTEADGRTIYANTVDTISKISCLSACEKEWPPVPGPATAGAGVDASKLGTAVRPDGSKQATYDGHPLYLFEADKAAGDKKGEGIADEGGKWHAATVSGTPAGGGSSGGDSSAPPSSPPPASGTY